MKALRSRRSGIALAVLILAAGAVAAILAVQKGSPSALHRFENGPAAKFVKAGDPDQQTKKDTPGGSLGAPASYEAQQLAALAYPSSTLPASLLNQERNYYKSSLEGRSPAKPGTWRLVGPTTSTQPAVLNFFNQYYGNGFNSSDLQVSGRVTAMAVGPCDLTSCTLFVAAAGGGVWRNDNALDANSPWTYVSGSFGTNAIGTLTYNASTHTLYAGTGEPNASSDSEAGVGIYASTNNGNSWTLLPGSSVFNARSISSIVVDPSHPGTLYVGDARGVRGVTGVNGGSVSLAPDAKPWGVWKSTDGGQTFTEVWDTPYPLRGVNHVELDSHGTLYAAAFQRGVWRSSDGGTTWEQVFATQDPTHNTSRTEFSLNTTADGHTRIYVGDGTSNGQTAVYRADSIDTTAATALTDGTSDPGYTKLTSDGSTAAGRRDAHFPTYDYCEGQCWYDNFVYSPPGHPDDVYIGGSFDYSYYYLYGGRAVLLSQDAGATWTDQTTSANGATGMHPDQHALITDPANPLLFFEGSDGGVISSSGQVTDDSASFCSWGNPATSSYNAACRNMHKAVPTTLTTLNAGLSTLQFQNVAVNPNSTSTLIGGTQDNGTWLGSTGSSSWNQTIYGDGGVAAFDATNPNYELNEFYAQYTDANFENGDPTKWVIVSGPFFASGENSSFYKPQIGDPVVGGTMFVGLQSVFRTQDGGGDPSYLEANCPEFTTPGNDPSCGDFVPLGGSNSDLTSSAYGADRQGGYVVSLARGQSDRSTLWAATATGRVFISKNAGAAAGSVSFTRLDSTSAAAPGRFVSGIAVDPHNPYHAWISYTGYNANTPATPGHVFDVVYDPFTNTARWRDIDRGTGPLGDLPVTDIARDNANHMLYAATDFGVFASTGDGSWAPAAAGMPQVETPWITIDQSSHTLYAATHGRGIWSLSLGR